MDFTHGPLAGLLMGLAELNCSELRLKRLSYRHGLLGYDKLFTYLVSEWLQDIKKNQLPSLLGGVGPMYSVVQLCKYMTRFVRKLKNYCYFWKYLLNFSTSFACFCFPLTYLKNNLS